LSDTRIKPGAKIAENRAIYFRGLLAKKRTLAPSFLTKEMSFWTADRPVIQTLAHLRFWPKNEFSGAFTRARTRTRAREAYLFLPENRSFCASGFCEILWAYSKKGPCGAEGEEKAR
jgi:hypothetical protein